MDLTKIVAEQVEDNITDEPLEDTGTEETVVEASEEVVEDTTGAETEVTTTETPTDIVESPAAKAAVTPSEQDDFAKRFGLQPGKNNRIPYDRVRKIVEKNERDVTAKVTKQLEETFKPKLTEYETKLKTYEEQLTNVNNFEQVMLNDQEQFLGWLSKVPQYQEFFKYVGGLVELAENVQKQQASQNQSETDPRPQPIQLPDGTYGYDEKGLAALEAWQTRQIEGKVTERIKPIEQRFQQEEQARQERLRREHHLKTVVEPQITAQLKEARDTWPNFQELEGEIEKALVADPKLNLERAYIKVYQSVVVPKMQTDAQSLRAKLLEEIKAAPPTTTAVTGRASKPLSQQQSFGSMEDLVAAQVKAKFGNLT